ncbi:MAG: hypothetical protein IT222_12185 [Crocinitomix sp.]|nr:hypothetical protein [Crocinitomix sp.]
MKKNVFQGFSDKVLNNLNLVRGGLLIIQQVLRKGQMKMHTLLLGSATLGAVKLSVTPQ